MDTNLESLDGRCLDLIAAFVGEKFPAFIFASKEICNSFLDYQIIINTEVQESLEQRKLEIEACSKSKKESVFTPSEHLHEKFCEQMPDDFAKLMNLCKNYKLQNKDITVLKLYFTFLGEKYNEKNDKLFMRQTHRYFYECRNEVVDTLDPIMNF